MQSWNLNDLDLLPHAPQILASTDDARAIALRVPAGESLQDHQVHEHAWVTVVSGEAEVATPDGQSVAATPGQVVLFEPGERHAVHAVTDLRLLLVLTPWPGIGHPGTMSLDGKRNVAAETAS